MSKNQSSSNRKQRVSKKPAEPTSVSFGKKLQDKTYNQFSGQTVKTIMDTEGFEKQVRDIIRKTNKSVGGNPKNNEFNYALAKIKSHYEQDIPALKALSLTMFAQLIDVDDLAQIASMGYSAAKSVYAIPEVKKFVDSALSNGYNKMKSLLTRGSSSPEKGVGAMSVNMDFIKGAMIPDCPPAGNPDDVPNEVYTNKLIKTYTFTTGTAGTGIWLINPGNFCTIATEVSDQEQWIGYRNSATYDPSSSAVITWSNHFNSPLGPSIDLIDNFRPLGMVIEVKPTTSNLNNQGYYLLGTYQRNMSDREFPFLVKGVSSDILSSTPGFTQYDMKTCGYTRVFPSTDSYWHSDPSRANSTTPNAFFGVSALMAVGCAASATFNVRITVQYSLVGTEDGMVLLRGVSPNMGPYTNEYVNYLKVMHPDIIRWSNEDITKYFAKFNGSVDYTQLLK